MPKSGSVLYNFIMEGQKHLRAEIQVLILIFGAILDEENPNQSLIMVVIWL